MKKPIIEFIIGIPVIIGVYALLEFLYSTFIVHIPFVFNIRSCSVCFAVWLACVSITYLAGRKSTDKTAKEKENERFI